MRKKKKTKKKIQITKMSGKEIVQGRVTEALPNAMFRIELEGGRMIIGFLSGKMKVHKISVILGDKVQVELDKYGGKATNRIIRRIL